MKAHSTSAVISSVFSHIQFVLAIISGFVLFPMIIHSVGTYHYGLWLATGEVVSYVLLGDLGVFAVLPWLIASRIGAEDLKGLRQCISDSIAIGCMIGGILFAFCMVALYVDPMLLGIPTVVWNVVLYPTMLLLFLNGVGYPFRAFNALLIGAQDVIFSGFLSILQSVLLIALTGLTIFSGTGILGLAWSTGFPPLLVSLFAFLRTLWKHPYAIQGMHYPNLQGCRVLFREGFGAWLGGLGVRLMVASNGIILASVGRPDWATIYASTGKISQILTPMCSIVPDSGLVGISHVHASNAQERTKRSVVCLILLYAIIPSFAAIGLLVLNPSFVTWWIGPDLYAGHYINILVAICLIFAGLSSGLVKLVSVVGWRQIVGLSTVLAGLVYAFLGYLLVCWHGLAGLAEAAICVWIGMLLPIGIYLIRKVYHVRVADFCAVGLRRWFWITLPLLIISSIIGISLKQNPLGAFMASIACTGTYGILLRPTLALAPWPEKVRHWLCRLRLIPNLSGT